MWNLAENNESKCPDSKSKCMDGVSERQLFLYIKNLSSN